MSRVLERTEQLAEFPAMGRPSARLPGLGVRELVVGEFLILYLAQPTRIDILAVVSGREAPPERRH